jgi:hypothetical protein
MMVDLLIAFTRRGFLRWLWIQVARVWMPARRQLLILDACEAVGRSCPPGEHVWDWPVERPVTKMAEMVAEQIRHAPRPLGLTAYVLEVGQRGVDAPATLHGTWDTDTPEQIVAFFAAHGEARPRRVVRLLLLGELLAVVKKEYQWQLLI